MKNIGNPFSVIKRIETHQELLDIAFKKAMKIKPPGGRLDGLARSRTHEMNRINTAANVLVSRLERIVKSFPSFNLIHPFYTELTNVLLNLDNTKIALGRTFGIIKFIRDIEYEIIQKLDTTNSKEENRKLRKSAFGRFSSILDRLNPHLVSLEKARSILNPLPGFNPYLPSIVVAGVPNTGKSSLIKLTTSGKPDIARYPFTTKKLIFGHRQFDFISVQFIDTPGLLDRPLDQRNKIELQAIAALKHLSDILVFLIDASSGAS
ncbi:MAG: NOG1 family protein, partial [Candidatus Kariarchaeaceae archaeon]